MEDNPLIIDIPGIPLPKQSYRSISKEKGGGGYTKAEVKAWENEIGWRARIAMVDRSMMEDLLEVHIYFFRPNHIVADLDNLSKAVLDGMKGIVYSDDKQIIDLHLHKRINKLCPGARVMVVKSREVYICDNLWHW